MAEEYKGIPLEEIFGYYNELKGDKELKKIVDKHIAKNPPVAYDAILNAYNAQISEAQGSTSPEVTTAGSGLENLIRGVGKIVTYPGEIAYELYKGISDSFSNNKPPKMAEKPA